jgi:hypothetical protein
MIAYNVSYSRRLPAIQEFRKAYIAFMLVFLNSGSVGWQMCFAVFPCKANLNILLYDVLNLLLSIIGDSPYLNIYFLVLCNKRMLRVNYTIYCN